MELHQHVVADNDQPPLRVARHRTSATTNNDPLVGKIIDSSKTVEDEVRTLLGLSSHTVLTSSNSKHKNQRSRRNESKEGTTRKTRRSNRKPNGRHDMEGSSRSLLHGSFKDSSVLTTDEEKDQKNVLDGGDLKCRVPSGRRSSLKNSSSTTESLTLGEFIAEDRPPAKQRRPSYRKCESARRVVLKNDTYRRSSLRKLGSSRHLEDAKEIKRGIEREDKQVRRPSRIALAAMQQSEGFEEHKPPDEEVDIKPELLIFVRRPSLRRLSPEEATGSDMSKKDDPVLRSKPSQDSIRSDENKETRNAGDRTHRDKCHSKSRAKSSRRKRGGSYDNQDPNSSLSSISMESLGFSSQSTFDDDGGMLNHAAGLAVKQLPPKEQVGTNQLTSIQPSNDSSTSQTEPSPLQDQEASGLDTSTLTGAPQISSGSDHIQGDLPRNSNHLNQERRRSSLKQSVLHLFTRKDSSKSLRQESVGDLRQESSRSVAQENAGDVQPDAAKDTNIETIRSLDTKACFHEFSPLSGESGVGHSVPSVSPDDEAIVATTISRDDKSGASIRQNQQSMPSCENKPMLISQISSSSRRSHRSKDEQPDCCGNVPPSIHGSISASTAKEKSGLDQGKEKKQKNVFKSVFDGKGFRKSFLSKSFKRHSIHRLDVEKNQDDENPPLLKQRRSLGHVGPAHALRNLEVNEIGFDLSDESDVPLELKNRAQNKEVSEIVFPSSIDNELRRTKIRQRQFAIRFSIQQHQNAIKELEVELELLNIELQDNLLH